MSDDLVELKVAIEVSKKQAHDLERGLEKIEEALSNANADIEEKLDEIRKGIGETANEIATTNAKINRPIWKDARFWTGLAWLPTVLATGWLFKALGDESYLLVKAHQALGTEVALREAVIDDENTLRLAIESSIADSIAPKKEKLGDALVEYLAPRFDSGFKHVGIVELGLQNAVSYFECIDRTGSAYQYKSEQPLNASILIPECVSNNIEHSYSSVFVVPSKEKIDILIAIAAGVWGLSEDEELQWQPFDKFDRFQDASAYSRFLEINLGGDQIIDLKYETPIRMGSGAAISYLELFSANGVIPPNLESGKILPVHPISISLTSEAQPNHAFSILVVIKKSVEKS